MLLSVVHNRGDEVWWLVEQVCQPLYVPREFYMTGGPVKCDEDKLLMKFGSDVQYVISESG